MNLKDNSSSLTNIPLVPPPLPQMGYRVFSIIRGTYIAKIQNNCATSSWLLYANNQIRHHSICKYCQTDNKVVVNFEVNLVQVG